MYTYLFFPFTSVIALGYGLDDRRFDSRQRLGIFLSTTVSRPVLVSTQLPIKWLPGALSQLVKRPGRGAIRPLHQYVFMVWCSVKKSAGTVLLSTFTLNITDLGRINGFLPSLKSEYPDHGLSRCIFEKILLKWIYSESDRKVRRFNVTVLLSQ
jgi:hypothetical protein